MTRSAIVLAILAVGLAACDKKTPTTPSNFETQAKFTAALSPANEVPAAVGPETSGSGTVTITLHENRDANGVLTGGTVDFAATFTGFPAGTTLTAAHIHPGFAGATGNPVVNTAIAAGEITMPAGNGSLNKTGITVTADTAAGILAQPQGYYFNIHTAANPGGVARGQLTRTE
jgi:hypothetical protein